MEGISNPRMEWTERVDEVRKRAIDRTGRDVTHMRLNPNDYRKFITDMNKLFLGYDIPTSELMVNYRGMLVLPDLLVQPNYLWAIYDTDIV
jgi:hypothetical protein